MDTTLSQCAVDDLSSSGLSQDIIGEMAILPLSDTTYTLYKGLQKSDHEGYLIPYHGVNPNFGRRKNIPPLVVDGDERKYSSPYEGGSHLYILPHDREMLRSPKCSIIIGEGEKTTAKYSQELRNLITPHQKYAAVGISGLWQFLSSPETLTISWKNHPIFFGFDVDIEFNSQSILAVYRMIGYLVSKDVPLSQILMFTWDIYSGKGGDDYLVEKEKQGFVAHEILSKLLENAISPFQVLKDRVSLQSACEQLVRGSDGILTRAHIDFLAHGLKSGITGATIPLVRKEIQRILYSQIPDLQDENAIFLGTQKQVKDKLYVDPLPVIAKNAWDIIRKRDRATRFFRRDAAPIFVENGLPYEITPFHLQSICDETIKWIVRTGDSTLDLSRRNVPSDVPRHMAFSTAVQSLPLPRLERIVHAPYFGQQRTLHKDPGYSQEHATLYVQNGKPFTVPEIPLCPTEEHIKIAKSWISEVLIDFPFVGSRQGADVWMNPERTNAIALMIEPFIRSWFPKTPLYMIEAPTEGTGKGLLADACLFPALGKEPIKTTAPVREEEWEKRITALLSCLPSVIYFDNVITELHSQYLCKALTSNEDHGRKLQTSEMVTYPNRATWIATGNNPRLSREMIRRTIRIRLTAFCEKPSARNGFHHAPLLEWMSSHRPELVWSILVLIQNYISQGSPRPKTPITVGSFEEWAYCLQGILECNGIWGFYQNHDELEKANDGGFDSIKPLIETWLAMIEPISDESTRKIATPPMKSKELYFALTENGNEFPLDVDDNPVRRIGTILGKNVDRTFGIGEDLWQLQKIPVSRNLMAWSLVLLENVS